MCEQRGSTAALHRSNTRGEKGLTHPSGPQLFTDTLTVFLVFLEPGSALGCFSGLSFGSAALGLVWIPELAGIAEGESSEL